MFKNLPNPLGVTRYHSLVINEQNFPSELEISAQTIDGEIMGVRHKRYPIEGVQFHPEAILTEHGHDLFRNFIENARGCK
jgi:anthranilate/para-aminobenzoate synthase component II